MALTRLSIKDTIVVGSTLFGMFFGAGNLIFPVLMGQMAGSNVIPAIIGFCITGVTIPIMAVAAIGMSNCSGLQELSKKVGKGYSYFFTCILYLTIGPFFAIPRCATTSFTTGVAPILPEGTSQSIPLFIFSACFFGLVLFFSLRPKGIMTWIGKIINPLFIAFLGVLVFVTLTNPAASISSITPIEEYQSGAIFNGLLEGYNTMDAIAGLAFGIIVVENIKSLGVHGEKSVALATLISGIIAGALMVVIYVLTTIMGTESRGLFDVASNGGEALVLIANHYLGTTGGVILAITITLACLKTSIGLVTACASTFDKMFPGKLDYDKWTIIFCVFSFIVSNVGLSALISYSIPFLMLIYPLAIVLIVLALAADLFHDSKYVYVWATAGAFISAIFDFIRTLPFGIDVSFVTKYLPLYDLGFGWVIPSIIGIVIGLCLEVKYGRRKKKIQK